MLFNDMLGYGLHHVADMINFDRILVIDKSDLVITKESHDLTKVKILSH